jgi:hypothetical protein
VSTAATDGQIAVDRRQKLAQRTHLAPFHSDSAQTPGTEAVVSTAAMDGRKSVDQLCDQCPPPADGLDVWSAAKCFLHPHSLIAHKTNPPIKMQQISVTSFPFHHVFRPNNVERVSRRLETLSGGPVWSGPPEYMVVLVSWCF